jgi:N-acetylmuramoyl-L-alanine amidase
MKLYKIAIVVGHSQTLPGARGVAPLNEYEYAYNVGLASLMKHQALSQGCESKVFFRDNVGLRECYNKVNAYAPHVAIELHFNAANQKARGTETLYGDKHPSSKKLAGFVQDAMVKVFSRTGKDNRGVKDLTDKDRGYINVNIAKCPSCLIEPFFGDQVDDAQLGLEKKQELSIALIDSMINFLLSEQ